MTKKRTKKHSMSQRKQRLDRVLVNNFALVFCSTQKKVHVLDLSINRFVALSNRAWELLSKKAWPWHISIAVFSQETNGKLRATTTEVVPDKAVLHSELNDFISKEHRDLYNDELGKGNKPYGVAFFGSPSGVDLDENFVLSIYERLNWHKPELHLPIEIVPDIGEDQ